MTTGRINQVTTLTRSKPPRVCGGLKGAAAAVPTGRRKQEAQSRLRLLGRARQAETGIPALPTRVPAPIRLPHLKSFDRLPGQDDCPPR
jgi:hypothetical protein